MSLEDEVQNPNKYRIPKRNPYILLNPDFSKSMKGDRYWNFIEELSRRIPKENRETQQKPEPDQTAVQTVNLDHVLEPLNYVFLPHALKDEVILRTGIQELLKGQTPPFPGCIFHGPPGTGKTETLKAVIEVYTRYGAYAESVSFEEMNSFYVGQLAKNIEQKIKSALRKAKETGKPAFLGFDEASSLVEQASNGATSVARHYQEAIDVMKRYIGVERRLVVGVCLNSIPESLDQALIREGRLTPMLFPYPPPEVRAEMWNHFTSKHGLIDLTIEQTLALAAMTHERQGAFIEEACRTYEAYQRAATLQRRGYQSLLDALKAGEEMPTFTRPTFPEFFHYVQSMLAVRESMQSTETRRQIGFTGN